MCNPPFHSSLEDALSGNKRKRDNLQKSRQQHPSKPVKNLNFGGQQAELYCQGGELQFIKSMINESKHFAHQVLYFSTLVSKTDNLNAIKHSLKKANAVDIQTVKMHQGNKTSRFIAWSFLDAEQRKTWKKMDKTKNVN
jgi:23S rRNA (adenine1618-N6)-methyltransferase